MDSKNASVYLIYLNRNTFFPKPNHTPKILLTLTRSRLIKLFVVHSLKANRLEPGFVVATVHLMKVESVKSLLDSQVQKKAVVVNVPCNGIVGVVENEKKILTIWKLVSLSFFLVLVAPVHL